MDESRSDGPVDVAGPIGKNPDEHDARAGYHGSFSEGHGCGLIRPRPLIFDTPQPAGMTGNRAVPGG